MLEHILKDDPVYRQLKDEVEDYCGPVLVSGCTDTAKWHLTSLIGNHKKKQFKIIIVPDENKARQWVEASHFFGEKVQYIPAKDPLFYTADVHGNAIARDRMLAIKKIVDDKCGTFVMTIDAVMDQVVPLSDIKNHKMTFKMGEVLEEATIAEEFVARGYEKAPFVEAPGEFAVRGGIIDIFPYNSYPDSEEDRKQQGFEIKKDFTSLLGLSGATPWLQYQNPVKRASSRLKFLGVTLYGKLAGRENLIRKYTEAATRFNGQMTKNVFEEGGSAAYDSWVVSRKCFDAYQTLLFEGVEFSAPADADTYLRDVYGDYMQLPPVEERENRHQVLEVKL